MSPTDLTEARGQLGLSVGQLALALAVERSTVHRWESGSRPIPRVVALAVECLQRREIPEPFDWPSCPLCGRPLNVCHREGCTALKQARS